MSKSTLNDDLNEIINHYLTDMMNAFRSSRNSWLSLEKEKEKYKVLLVKAKKSSLSELLDYFFNFMRNNDQGSPTSTSHIPRNILENDENSQSYEDTIKKVESFIKSSKSQGFNKFIIAGDYSVSMRGVETNADPKQITLRLLQREYIFWHVYDFTDKLNKRIIHLAKMTLIYQFSFFEACLKDLFKVIYEYKPELMRSNSKNLSNREIIESESKEKLLNKILEKEVDWWGYQNIDKIAKRINTIFKINLKRDFTKWKDLREAYYLRNMIVHNSGIINEISCNKVGYDKSRIGERIDVKSEYIEKIYTIIRENLILIKNGLLLLS